MEKIERSCSNAQDKNFLNTLTKIITGAVQVVNLFDLHAIAGSSTFWPVKDLILL